MLRSTALIILIVLSTFSTAQIALEPSVKCEVQPVEVVTLSTAQKIIKVLQDSGYTVRMQQIILAQAKHESGSFKNQLTRKHNNVFAMNHSKSDPYSLNGTGHAEGRSGFASYNSIEDNVRAYIWYTRKRQYPSDATLEQYVEMLKQKHYFQADKTLYRNCLQKHIDNDIELFITLVNQSKSKL